MIGNADQTFRTTDISFSPTATANPANSSESNESPLFVCSWGFVAFLVGVIAASGIWLTIRSQRIKTEKEIELHTPVHTSTYGLEVVASPVHSGSNLQNQNFNVELSKYLKDTSPNTSPNDSNTIGVEMNWKLFVLFASQAICQNSNNSTQPKSSIPPESSAPKPTTTNPPPTSAPPATTNPPQTSATSEIASAPPTTQTTATIASGTATQSSAKVSGTNSQFSNSPDPTGDTGSSEAAKPVLIFGWVVLATFIAAILGASAWFSYRYYRKKNKVVQDKNLDDELEYTPAEHLFAPRPSTTVAPIGGNIQKAYAPQSSPLAIAPNGSESANSAKNSYMVPISYPPPEHSPYAPVAEQEQNYENYNDGNDYGTYERDGNGALYTYGAESVQDGDYENTDPDARFPNKDTLDRVISEPSDAGVPDDRSSDAISDSANQY
ncbi:hypothetical protein HDV04_000595 [Boothiomyces sp. JEL0838]|nr:hypothetical protein HDV04_000595 [Boothiomyces sp. JEL0838]